MIEIIPTCDDPMSIYTLIAIFILVFAGSVLSRFVYKEIECVNNRQTDIELTISNMSIDIAVTKESIENIESSINETKRSLADINAILLRRP